MRHTFVVIALISLACLASPVETILISATQTPGPSPSTTQPGVSKAKTQILKFEPRMMGKMRTGYGAHLGFTDFKASDGVGLGLRYNATSGSVRSDLVFEHEIVRAAKVISRVPKEGSAGKVVGERAEVLYRYSDREYHAVL